MRSKLKFLNLDEFLEWIYAHGVPGDAEFGMTRRRIDRLKPARLEAWSVLLAGEKVIGFAFIVMEKGEPVGFRNGYEIDSQEVVNYIEGVRRLRSPITDALRRSLFAKKV